MKVRLQGTEEQLETLIKDIKSSLSDRYDIISISKFYPNNRYTKESKESRCYIDLEEK